MKKLKLALYGLSLTLLGFITGALLVIGFNSFNTVIKVVVLPSLEPMEESKVGNEK
ncbi:MAG: hypothetical protein ABFD79_14640 [Phycisphaerales bacterium]